MKIDQENIEALDNIHLGIPHPKPHMTSKLGRAIERASYLDLFLASLLAILVFTTYFAIAPRNHGIPHESGALSRILQAFYFTVVTSTSLGYGDLSPQGFGRFVACVAVLFGLVVVAFVIGKIASERSQATIYLLHTSDRERRLRGFAEDIALSRNRLEQGIANGDLSEARLASKEMATMLEGASNYIYFHAHHSNLGDYGNAPALYRFLFELRNNVRPIFGAMSSPVTDLALYHRLNKLVGRMEGTFKAILVMQSDPHLDWTGMALCHLKLKSRPPIRLSRGQSTLFSGFTHELNLRRKELAQRLTIDKLIKVLAACPTGPVATWPKGEHKRIASELGVSNGLSSRCIADLLEQGRLPK